MPEQPGKPDKPDVAGKQYQFNLGLYRIETLSNILEFSAKKYRNAIMERTPEAVSDYQATVNLLYTETYIYMEEETDFEIKGVKQDREGILTHILDDFDINTEKEAMERLKKVRRIYLEIREVLQKVGIDIPEKEKIGETEAFFEGA